MTDSIKIIHIADGHYCPAKKEEFLLSHKTALDTGKKEGVNLWAYAGDMFNAGVKNTLNAGFPELVEIIQEMLNLAPMVVVDGTVTHDIPGCYEIFTQIEAKHNFTIIQPGQSYFLTHPSHGDVFVSADPWSEDDRLLILGCPEPQKTWFLQGKSMSKDESDQAITQGMRDVFLGMGAIRKIYSDLPCLFLYHGTVTGSKACTGQVMRPGINIRKDDLLMIDPKIEAHYAGSVYPVNWGELDRKGFNYVKLLHGQTYGALGHIHLAQPVTKCGAINMRRYDFPHPPMKKIILGDSFEGRDGSITIVTDSCLGDVSKFRIWLEYKGTKEQLAEFDKGKWEKILETEGALPGSKVTTTLIHEETVRTAGIQEAEYLRDKVEIYHANSADSTVNLENVLEKADTIEAEAKKQGAITDGLFFKLKKTRLRGATGIFKGIGKEEIIIDFDNMDPGLIALIGRNGTGKTTLLENMHMFPYMLTRAGKLQSHFMLRDSAREVWGVDERTGDEYRCLLNIDGKNKSGSVEYFLFKNGESITNGRKEDYEKKINQLFGSLELFRRSVFVTQKNTKTNPSLEDATKGEKKALFTELAGIDYLQVYSEMSKDRGDVIEGEIKESELKLTLLQGANEALEKLNKEKETVINKIDFQKDQLADLEKAGQELADQKKKIDLVIKENNRIQSEISTSTALLAEKQTRKDELHKEIQNLNTALEKKDEAAKTVQEYEDLQKKEKDLLQEKTQILEENAKKKQVFDEKVRDYEDIKRKCENLIKDNNISIEKIEKDNRFMEKESTQMVTCPNCKTKFTPLKSYESRQLEKNIEDGYYRIHNLKVENEETKFALSVLEEPPEPVYDLRYEKIDNNLSRLQLRLKELQAGSKIHEARSILAKSETAETEIAKKLKQRNTIDVNIKEIKHAVDKLYCNYNTVAEEEGLIVDTKLEQTRKDYSDVRAEIAGHEAELKAIDKAIEKLKTDIREKKLLTSEVNEKRTQMIEWRYLQKACGRDGIQALELDALAPGICDYINMLLPQDVTINRYTQAKIKTTRDAGTGKNTHQVEDFNILFLDSVHQDWVDLSDLSGGEARWAVQAVSDAFGIIRKNNTGMKFLSVFKDEADGALDQEAKEAYFHMLEKAHIESGRHHTIVITHSPAIQEMIPQKIVMNELEEMAAEKEELFEEIKNDIKTITEGIEGVTS